MGGRTLQRETIKPELSILSQKRDADLYPEMTWVADQFRRLAGEHRQTARIANGLARRTFVLPWLPESPVGVAALGALTAGAAPSS